MAETRIPSVRTKVEDLEAELAAKEEARDASIEAVQKAAERLEELERELAHTTDIEEYERLEVVRDAQRRIFNVARASREQNSVLAAEAKEALAEAEKDAHRERHGELEAERAALLVRRDDLADRLKETLHEERRLNSEMPQELRHYDPDQANNVARDVVSSTRRYVRQAFKEWLR